MTEKKATTKVKDEAPEVQPVEADVEHSHELINPVMKSVTHDELNPAFAAPAK